MRAWTMVVETTVSPPAAVAVDGDQVYVLDAGPERPDIEPDTVVDVGRRPASGGSASGGSASGGSVAGGSAAGGSVAAPPRPVTTAAPARPSAPSVAPGQLTALIGSVGTPTAVVMVVPADTDADDFAALTDAVARADLPTPTWVPDAVARSGEALTALDPGHVGLVVDTRGADVEIWGVRPSAIGGKVGVVEPVHVEERVERLLVETLRTKLRAAAPDSPGVADALDRHDDTAHALRRDLRDASRELSEDLAADTTAEIVLAVGGVEVSVATRELADVVARAIREEATDVLGAAAAGAAAVVLTDAWSGMVRDLADALDVAAVVPRRPGAALGGAAALVRSRPAGGDGPAIPSPRRSPENRSVPAASTAASAPSPAVDEPAQVPASTPPRWAVPALSTLVAAALVGATGVLVAGAATPLLASTVSTPPAATAPAAPAPASPPAFVPSIAAEATQPPTSRPEAPRSSTRARTTAPRTTAPSTTAVRPRVGGVAGAGVSP